MLKFFYRLKRRHGVVLFAVIAIMTLLIAMATTAYFTARASYQTVVSNYDFSQTYLSAISISDMLIEAVTQNTSKPGSNDSDFSKNNYGKLKELVQGLRDKTPNTAAATITGYSVHHTTPGATSGGTAATESTLLTLAASQPIEAGIFDAAKVEIKYVKKEPVLDAMNQPTDETKHYFTFTTTVYYRDTTITVQDTIINISGSKSNNDASPFSRFFTATSQNANGKSSRVVVIDTKNISDDSYFENDYTLIGMGETASQAIDGSIISSGSVYMYKTDTSGIKAPAGNDRNDWFIGKDLVLTRNADSLDLHGNNLYIGGDLIIARGGGDLIKAANIYVKGNIYYLGSGSGSTGITGNVYLGGTVSNDASAVTGRISELDGYLGYQGYSSNLSGLDNNNNPFSYTHAGVWDDSTLISTSNIIISADGHKYEEKLSTDVTLGDAFKEKTMARSYDTYTANESTTLKNKLTIDPSMLTMDTSAFMSADELNDPEGIAGGLGEYTTTTESGDDYNGKTYTTIELKANSDGTVTCHKTVTGEKKTYSYPPPDYTQHIDITYINTDETTTYSASGNLFTFNYDDGSTVTLNKSTNTVTSTGTGGKGGVTISKSGDKVICDIAYTEDGYLLDIKNANGGNITYNFGTKKDETMPVVLMANCNDSSSTPVDQNGYNAFSWICATDRGGENTGKHTLVQLTPDAEGYGNVIFEIGNYMKVIDDKGTEDTSDDEETMQYVQYSRAKDNAISVPTYYETQDLVIGTQAQIAKINLSNLMNDPGFEGMLESGTNYAQPGLENRIMLVSNKNDAKGQGIAINGNLSNHAFCGYFYAPNGTYELHASSPRRAVFGGMIVSIYDTKHSYFTFCSPDPQIIKSLLGKMSSEKYNTDPVPTAGIWSLQEGRNYLG